MDFMKVLFEIRQSLEYLIFNNEYEQGCCNEILFNIDNNRFSKNNNKLELSILGSFNFGYDRDDISEIATITINDNDIIKVNSFNQKIKSNIKLALLDLKYDVEL